MCVWTGLIMRTQNVDCLSIWLIKYTIDFFFCDFNVFFFIRNDFNMDVLKAFVNLHEFSDMILVQALRWVIQYHMSSQPPQCLVIFITQSPNSVSVSSNVILHIQLLSVTITMCLVIDWQLFRSYNINASYAHIQLSRFHNNNPSFCWQTVV